ncbi:MAG: competence type IV pilus major pilin ComGC [Mitsuokella sp.]|uniref:competence type IV pilus major pilin ComGC n=1 Tax=Mitsuokella sp. TaxID=2049034 RepID=UPI003F086848
MKTKMTSRMRNNRQSKEAGFTLIGMLIAVGIVAILAMIAVPKFTSAIASANTARIQADLSTINTAISVYEIENGEYPENIGDLGNYLQNTKPKPPTGKCYINGSETKIPEGGYDIDRSTHQATCGGKKIAEFSKTKDTENVDQG